MARRGWWIGLLTMLLQAQANSCSMVSNPTFQSPNGRYTLVQGPQRIEFRRGEQRLWSGQLESADQYVLAEDGETILALDSSQTTVYDGTGKKLATGRPFPFQLDEPRTCWRAGREVYLELAQGDIYRLSENGWRKEDFPVQVPAEVRQHQLAPVAEKAIRDFLKRDSRPAFAPRFHNLSPPQRTHLTGQFQAGDSRAGLALAMGGFAEIHDQLLRLACARNYEQAREAQQALVFLDGPERAAAELVPALQAFPGPELMRLYTLVPCPEAVAGLVGQLPGSHAALVAQTRVDLGKQREGWTEWLKERRRERLSEFHEPSALLWKAQQDDPYLAEWLLTQPRLAAVVDFTYPCPAGVQLEKDRLTSSLSSVHQRILEWSLRDGEPLTRVPDNVTSGIYVWNSRRRQLWFTSGFRRGLWQDSQPVFQEDSDGRTLEGKRPAWWPPGMTRVEFSSDGSELIGDWKNGKVRIDISNGSKCEVDNSGYGEFSPDHRYWVGGSPLRFMDWEHGLIYQDDLGEQGFFSPDSQKVAFYTNRQIRILETKDRRVVQEFLTPREASGLAFDASGRQLAVLTEDRAYVYDLQPDPPDLGYDSRLVTELWTGYRLHAGGAEELNAAEYWLRRRRLEQARPVDPLPYLPIGVGVFGIVLLGFAYFALKR